MAFVGSYHSYRFIQNGLCWFKPFLPVATKWPLLVQTILTGSFKMAFVGSYHSYWLLQNGHCWFKPFLLVASKRTLLGLTIFTGCLKMDVILCLS
jgi:hypothetical protein